MPLTLEGKIICAQQMRESEQDFLERFGSEKLKERLGRTGLFAYGFSDHDIRRDAILDVFSRLCEDIRCGDNAELREKYGGERFRTEFYPPHIVAIEKPFPDLEFRSRLEIAKIPYEIVPVYRISELTEDEIRHRLNGGIWRFNRDYVDLSGSLTRWRNK